MKASLKISLWYLSTLRLQWSREREQMGDHSAIIHSSWRYISDKFQLSWIGSTFFFFFFLKKKIQFKSHKIELKTYNFPTSDKQHKTYYYLKSNSPIDGRVRYWLNWWVHLLWRWCLISRPDPLAQTPPVWPPPDVSHYAHLRATLHWAPVAADSATSKQSFQNICL